MHVNDWRRVVIEYAVDDTRERERERKRKEAEYRSRSRRRRRKDEKNKRMETDAKEYVGEQDRVHSGVTRTPIRQ